MAHLDLDCSGVAWSPLQKRWLKDRALRQRQPLSVAHRPGMGLAAARVGSPVVVDGVPVYPNRRVIWMALRDVKAGHWRVQDAPSVEAVLATKCRADLVGGMPAIRFDQQPKNWNFRQLPFNTVEFRSVGPTKVSPNMGYTITTVQARGDTLNSKHSRFEFEVFQALSEAMTFYAFTGLKENGSIADRAWFFRCPPDWRGIRTRPVPAAQWFPRAFLEYPRRVECEMFDEAMLKKTPPACRCAECGRRVQEAVFDAMASNDVEFDDVAADGFSWWVAKCPHCNTSQRWEKEKFVVETSENFPHGFRTRFCADVAVGLPQMLWRPATYLGPTLDEVEHKGFRLVRHRFRAHDGMRFCVILPTTARVLVRRGEVAQPGQIWARALPFVPERYAADDPASQWELLGRVVPSGGELCYLQHLWFNQQVLRDYDHDRVLYPADLVVNYARRVPPRDLHWYFGRAEALVPEGIVGVPVPGTLVFPVIPLRRWWYYRQEMPGDVALNADITDPRFVAPILDGFHEQSASARILRRDRERDYKPVGDLDDRVDQDPAEMILG